MTGDRMRAVGESLRAWAARQQVLAAEIQRALAPLVMAAKEAHARSEAPISPGAIELAVRHAVTPLEAECLIRRAGTVDAEACLAESRRRAVSPRDVAREMKR